MFRFTKCSSSKGFRTATKGFLVGVITTSIISTSMFAYADMQSIQVFFNNIKIKINGNVIDTGNDQPCLYNGRTYLPIRYVAEKLGATVKWNETNNTVEIDSVSNDVYSKSLNQNNSKTEPITTSKSEPETEGMKVVKFANGDKYIGEMNNGVPNGIGKYYYSDGRVFYGSWENGKKNGEGVIIHQNGNKYIGEFKNGNPYGFGIHLLAKIGQYCCGEFTNTNVTGRGYYKVSDNECYFGDFKNGEMSGKGTYYYSSGDYYFGDILNAKRSGYGTYFYSADKISKTGYWNEDQFITNVSNNNTNTQSTNINNNQNSNNTSNNNTSSNSNQAYINERKRQFEQELSDLQTKLNNAKNEKTARVLKKQSDGSYAWVYEADSTVVAKYEKQYQDKLNQYNLWKAANNIQ